MKPKRPCYVELESLNDLARLVCALERVPLPLLELELDGQGVLAAQFDFLAGRPVVYYAKHKNSGGFLAYRNAGNTEDVTFVDAVTNPMFAYAPIIRVARMPDAMKDAKPERNSACTSVKLGDLTSLAKVSSYKMFLEEAPMPLYLVGGAKGGTLGTFMNVGDDGTSYFYYVDLESVPAERFLKYSVQRAGKPAFTNKTDEHGYIYMKIVKLRKEHPLVVLYD